MRSFHKPQAATLLAMEPTDEEAETLRREFAIHRILDEYLGHDLVPRFRRITGYPVNRSTVIRALLLACMQRWSMQDVPTERMRISTADTLVLETINSLLSNAEANPGG